MWAYEEGEEGEEQGRRKRERKEMKEVVHGECGHVRKRGGGAW